MFFNRRRKSDYTIMDAPAGAERSNGNGTHWETADNSLFSLSNSHHAGEELLPLRTRQGNPIQTFPGSTVQALRYMATRLLVNDELPKRLALVSALREEGVTYNALALATLLAYDTAKRICYVDLNWWHPSRQLQAALLYNRGLAGVLTAATAWDSVLVNTNYTNLALLPAGELAAQQRATTARSSKLVEAITEVSSQFDHLILDLPAVLTTSDAIPLAALAEAGCMVVRQGVSTSELSNRALADMQHVPMLGIILNRTRTEIPAAILKWIPQE